MSNTDHLDRSKPHRRLNLLTHEWVLVSPQRATRPWLGAVEKPNIAQRPSYDPQVLPLPRQHPRRWDGKLKLRRCFRF